VTAQAAIPAVDARFYVSGASAARQIPPALAGVYCDPGVNDLALYQNTATPNDYKITICTYLNAAPVPTALRGLKIAVFSRAAGGSLFGVKPIAVRQRIRFINGATCPADDGNPGTTQNCPDLSAAGDFLGTGDFPDVGISDEDGAFACAASPGQCTAAEQTGLTSVNYHEEATYQIIWVLQAHTSNPINNISAEVASAIFAGTYRTMDQVQAAMNQTVTSTEGLKICRRTNTSGTQAGHRHLWTGISYCGATTPLGFVTAADSDAGIGYTVIENSSSGAVETCLTSGADLDSSFGINSLENAGVNPNIKQLQVDGVAPTLANAARGQWKYYHESTAQYNTVQMTAGVNAELGNRSTATQRQAFADLFLDSAQDPATQAAAGLNGILAIPTLAAPSGPPWSAANPVGWSTKLLGVGGSNCRAPLLAYP
jgi:hypothetical protein